MTYDLIYDNIVSWATQIEHQNRHCSLPGNSGATAYDMVQQLCDMVQPGL